MKGCLILPLRFIFLHYFLSVLLLYSVHLLPGFLFPEPASDSHTDSVPMTLSELPGPAVPVLLLASEIQILPEFLMLPVIQASSEESDYHRNLVPAVEDLAHNK